MVVFVIVVDVVFSYEEFVSFVVIVENEVVVEFNLLVSLF